MGAYIAGSQQNVATQPFEDYYFLTGLVRVSSAEKIIVVDTHSGASSCAMAMASEKPDATRIVTFDFTSEGVKQIGKHPVIPSYQLDADSEAAFATARRRLGPTKADSIYVDITHNYCPVIRDSLNYIKVSPTWLVVLDDMNLHKYVSDA